MSSDDKLAEASKSSNETLHEMPSIEWMVLHHLFIIVFTLFGNILLIFVIFKNNQMVRRKRVTPVQILMLHMCAADILFAVITMIPTMIMTITVPFFFGPNFLCKLTKLLQVFPMYASSFLLVAISADRYQAICRPLASMRSAYNRPSMYAVLAWSAAFIFSTPQLSLFQKKNGDCMGAYTSPIQYTIYVIVFNVLVWLLPSAIAGFLYYQVCKAVWQSTSFTSNLRSETPQRTSSTEERSLELSPSQQLYSQQKGGILQCLELDRRRVQTVKLTLTIVAANFLLWTPFCLISIIDAVWPYAISMLSIWKFENGFLFRSDICDVHNVFRESEQLYESMDMVLFQSTANA
ncbi:unnamed protein product [Auanema sp. JU1783]|nr:unnamed protein product [Auanema sp. JU1783]